MKYGRLERTDGSSITEGIGQGRVTKNLEGAPIDDALAILDTDAVNMVRNPSKVSSVTGMKDPRDFLYLPIKN